MPADIDADVQIAMSRATDKLSWSLRLTRNEDGKVLPTMANLMVIFANDPQLRGMLAFNAFTAEPLIMRPAPVVDDGEPELAGPYPRQWGQPDVVLVLSYIQRVWASRVTLPTCESAMLTEATLRPFHPVVDWLDGLVWDKKPRLDRWLSNAFDAEDTPLIRSIAAKVLIAAVRRVKRPGVKFDQMLVLEGLQGIGKSRSLRILFGETWFSDAIPSDLTSKDAAMALLGVWCLEFAEIEHLIRAEVETIKAFLSRSVDRYRPPYAKSYVERPRQGILIGTTNSDDYLRDASGNRRIWPVKCRRADVDWLSVNREQLWAEAVDREAKGEAIWLEDEQTKSEATEAQAERMESDPWLDAVVAFASQQFSVTTAEVMTDCLSIPKAQQTKALEMRVAKILRRMGWRRRQRKLRGVPAWLFENPKATTSDEEVTTSANEVVTGGDPF